MADYSKFKNANGDDLVLQDKELRDNVGFDSFTENEKILAGNINHNTAGIILVHDGKIINANESSGGLYYDDSRQGIFVSVDGETIIEDYKCLSVANPVPDTNNANDGDVLTYDGNTDEIVWAAPQGGLPSYTQSDAGKVLAVNQAGNGVEWSNVAGGGGNPYTKATVTPGESYDSGRSSSTAEGYPYDGYTLYDQEVNITNNTYSILSTTIGYYPEYYDEGHEWESEYYHPEHALDTLIINLDANTEFPMAVVEFDVDSDSNASVNKIKVKVGNKTLTRMYDAPHFEDFPVLFANSMEFGEFVEHPAQQYSSKYWEIGDVYYYNKSSNYFALTNSSRVQVHIFGNCFRVISDGTVGIPAAS